MLNWAHGLATKGHINGVTWRERLWLDDAPVKLALMKRKFRELGWRELTEKPDTSGSATSPYHSAEGPAACCNQMQRTYWVRPDLPEAQQVYLLAHELGHAKGHGPVKAKTSELELAKAGLISPRDIAPIRRREAIAETTAALVMCAWGVEPNWGYFACYHITPQEIEEILPIAVASATWILGEDTCR